MGSVAAVLPLFSSSWSGTSPPHQQPAAQAEALAARDSVSDYTHHGGVSFFPQQTLTLSEEAVEGGYAGVVGVIEATGRAHGRLSAGTCLGLWVRHSQVQVWVALGGE